MTDNEIGYRIYFWEQRGYHFIPDKYDPSRDFTKYLNYYTDPARNEKLKAAAIAGTL